MSKPCQRFACVYDTTLALWVACGFRQKKQKYKNVHCLPIPITHPYYIFSISLITLQPFQLCSTHSESVSHLNWIKQGLMQQQSRFELKVNGYGFATTFPDRVYQVNRKKWRGVILHIKEVSWGQRASFCSDWQMRLCVSYPTKRNIGMVIN